MFFLQCCETLKTTSFLDQAKLRELNPRAEMRVSNNMAAAGKGILIGLASAFGSAAVVGLLFYIIYFLRYTTRGRILLDRLGRPGEFDDEQTFLREEAEALENMDESSRIDYLRAKGMSKFVNICNTKLTGC